ncbi:hypothetical protein DPMN_130987 [Dreissena polymorpha]|uniref:Uncharacterized protein n=1 Tax=Dreissena polymorpha TaxID=45954 RepID=A0A9D4H3T7_DREPO|nr:hypothetical protein DPMN_130987 [Dreissena polymorpha]
MRHYRMNISLSQDTIDIIGNLSIDNTHFMTVGTFASFYKIIAFQSKSVVLEAIYGRNMTFVEFNGRYTNPLLIDGVIIFKTINGTYSCPMQMRRGPGK